MGVVGWDKDNFKFSITQVNTCTWLGTSKYLRQIGNILVNKKIDSKTQVV